MNAIRQTQALNKRELENATPPSASWHADYRDTAYIYIGGLNLDLTEGDVVTIFSQFGNPTHLNLIRDKETGKSKGFAFLKYEDQRSCDLAVDNLTGADVLGRLLRVDHTRYKKRDDEDEDTYRIDRLEAQAEGDDVNGNGKRGSGDDFTDDDGHESRHRRKKHRPMLKEEQELEQMLAVKQDGEEEQDPMRDYLIREKREEVERAKERQKSKKEKSEHKHRHTRRSRDDEDVEDGERRRHRRRHREEDEDRTEKEHKHRRHHGDEDDDDVAEAAERRHRHRDNRRRDEENHADRSDRKRRSDKDRDADRDHRESRSSHRGRDGERRRKRSDSRDRDQS